MNPRHFISKRRVDPQFQPVEKIPRKLTQEVAMPLYNTVKINIDLEVFHILDRLRQHKRPKSQRPVFYYLSMQILSLAIALPPNLLLSATLVSTNEALRRVFGG